MKCVIGYFSVYIVPILFFVLFYLDWYIHVTMSYHNVVFLSRETILDDRRANIIDRVYLIDVDRATPALQRQTM